MTLARHGNRVLFVENTGVRTPGLRDVPRLKHRLLNWWKGTKGFRQVRGNLFVYAPVILPFPYSRLARWVNRKLLFRALQRWMRATGFRRPIVWTFLPTPIVRDLIREVDAEMTIYYCIDDLASSSPQARRIRRSEVRLFREADLVFVTSEKLRQRAVGFNERVHCFPFGVYFARFEQARQQASTPADLQAVRRPVVGYIGGIRKEIDQDLLEATARRLPEVTFVLVGPVQTDVSRLRAPNIRLIGQRSHEVLPAYVKQFNVGVIPYLLNEYTAHIYPTKLNEYLAMGIPVVATDLPEIRRFNAEHGELVTIARNAEEFSAALQGAVSGGSAEAAARRIEAARQNSWDARITKMSALIEERLAAKRAGSTPWETTLRRVYRTARRQVVRLVVAAAALYLLLFRSSFIWWVAGPLQVSQPPRPADAIVVFAGGVGESGTAGGGYQERVKQAVDLYRQGAAPRMIFSSGYAFVFHETEVMKDLAIALGVPAEAIVLETKATNTYENVRLVDRVLDQHRWRSILLVSSPYHMRRALLTWRKVAPDMTVIPTPAPQSQFYAHSRGASMDQIRGILQEYLAILVYLWRGWM